MGVLYDVLFKSIGRGDATSAVAAGAVHEADDDAAAANDPPEWVLDKRDGGTQLVWRRYGDAAAASRRRRVEFLDAVQVREFERDDYSLCGGRGGGDDDGNDADDDDDDDQAYWTDDWCDGGRDQFTNDTKRLRFYEQSDDCPVLVAVSVTVLGMCISLAYMFAPVRWLIQHLLVDD